MEIKEYESKMQKSLASLEEEYASIRAGRANPHILDKITVDYYGAPSPLQSVANISVPEARVIQIQPWESSLIKEIEKAIMVSDIGITPSRRKELVKDVKKKAENAKVAIRNIRRDGNDTIKKSQKSNEISEDEAKQLEDKIQKLTDKYVGMIDNVMESKSQEIMKV